MFNNFRALSLSFKNTPIEIREQVALDEIGCLAVLQEAKNSLGISEILVVSTCNRTEFYYCSDGDQQNGLIKILAQIRDISNVDAIKPFFQPIDDHTEAVTYLYRVSMGLEAKVVGDIQISNQIKRSYQWAADSQCAGPFMHRLMHSIFYTNKRVSQETAFRDGGASVAYVASEMATDFATQIISPKVLVLGVGEIGEDVCKNLQGAFAGEIYVMNRTASKAEALAKECNFLTLPFEHVHQAIQDCDIIICSIARNTPFITKQLVECLDIPGYKHFIDLSVPRSIELEVDDIPGVNLYNIDNITARTNKTVEKRIKAIPYVEQIISEAVEELSIWSKEMIVSPTIQKMKNALDTIRREELNRFSKGLSEKETKVLEKITKSMVQKIIKLPVLELKAACQRDQAETLVDVLNNLFDLEKKESIGQ
ncbi:MAG: glutamyl-tRNA reductase [Cytophagales bacterium]|nr:glutamyl-tRNA reductase [Cytophagales bacterium]